MFWPRRHKPHMRTPLLKPSSNSTRGPDVEEAVQSRLGQGWRGLNGWLSALHGIALPTVAMRLLTALGDLKEHLFTLMVTSASSEYLSQPHGRRRTRKITLPLLFLLFVIADFDMGVSNTALASDLATLAGVAVCTLFFPQNSLWSDLLNCIIIGFGYFLWSSLDSGASDLQLEPSAAALALPFLILCGFHLGGIILCALLFAISGCYISWSTGGSAALQVFGCTAIGTIACVFIESHFMQAFCLQVANERLVANCSHCYFSVDLRSGTLTEVSESMVKLFQTVNLKGELFASLPQEDEERPAIAIQDLISAYGRSDGVSFATFSLPSKVFDCRMVPYLKTSRRLQVCLQLEGEVRQRSTGRSRFVDVEGNAQDEVPCYSSNEQISMASFGDYVLHEMQQVSLLEGQGQGQWGQFASQEALQVARQALQDIEAAGSQREKCEAAAYHLQLLNRIMAQPLHTAIWRGGGQQFEGAVRVWRVDLDATRQVEAERHQIIAQRWADVRSAYLALWRHRFKKVFVQYIDAGGIAWDLTVRGRVIVEVDPEGPAARCGVQPGDLVSHANAHIELSGTHLVVFSREAFPMDLLFRIIVFLGCPVGWHDHRRSQIPNMFARTLMRFESLSWI